MYFTCSVYELQLLLQLKFFFIKNTFILCSVRDSDQKTRFVIKYVILFNLLNFINNILILSLTRLRSQCIGGSNWGRQGHAPPSRSNFFHLHAKTLPNNRFLAQTQGLAAHSSPSGKSWISHCNVYIFLKIRTDMVIDKNPGPVCYINQNFIFSGHGFIQITRCLQIETLWCNHGQGRLVGFSHFCDSKELG